MQPLQPELLDVNALIEKTTGLLRHVLGRDIVLDTMLAEHLWPILADPTQLEASFLNLASNAHDAMPQGGNLLISTRNVVVDHAYQERHPDAVPGAYTLIQFCDTGTGIAPENMDRIFEPFFTTKTVGKGTGLGLSMIFGFVRQSGGHLSVDSVPGMSTTIRLFLPRHERQMDAAVSHAQKIDVKGGPERVLVVEDNEQLRHATARKLTDLGYDVRVAEQADTALDILDHWCPVDLLFTDVVMPGRIDGIELAKRATQSQRCSKVLVTSGFAGVRDGLSRLTDSAFPFLGKPYRHDELARAVRRVLDETGVMASGRCSTAGL
jgi:CheY-like chemotaxis protein